MMERPSPRLTTVVLIGAGGFLGASLRYGFGTVVPTTPLAGTLTANVLGSFLLGALLSESALAARLSPDVRLMFGTGFCGSLTTYSTFAAEITTLSAPFAASYVGLTYGLGFGGLLAGRLLARWVS